MKSINDIVKISRGTILNIRKDAVVLEDDRAPNRFATALIMSMLMVKG
jgi:hypothetical protein